MDTAGQTAAIRSRPVSRPRPGALRPAPVGVVLRSIWTAPRRAVREGMRTDGARFVIAVAWLSGVGETLLNAALGRSAPPDWGPFVLFFSLTMGPLLGFAYFELAGVLLAAAGRILGGTADASDARVALACSIVPQLVALPLWIPAIAFYGVSIFTKGDDMRPAVLVAFLALQIALLAWGWTLRVVTLAEAHGFSLWRAFVAIVLAGVAMLVLIAGAIIGLAALVGTGAKA